MAQILDLEKVRFDGQVLKEGMSVRDLDNPTGQPVRVRTVQWKQDGTTHSYTAPLGLLAFMTKDRQYVAILEALDESWLPSKLLILNADGSLRMEVQSDLLIDGRLAHFHFMAVYSSPRPGGSVIRIAAKPDSGYRFATDRGIDLDVESGEILGAVEIR